MTTTRAGLTPRRELAKLRRTGELRLAYTGEPCFEEWLLAKLRSLTRRLEADPHIDPEKLRRWAYGLNVELLLWEELAALMRKRREAGP